MRSSVPSSPRPSSGSVPMGSPLSSRSSRGTIVSSSGLPPPPMMATSSSAAARNSYSQRMSQSMTIDEMRELHHRALSEAEAKRTELRLVLASRYRELVGSSDEVLKMRERSQELHELVHALPGMLQKLVEEKDHVEGWAAGAVPSSTVDATTGDDDKGESKEAHDVASSQKDEAVLQIRRELSRLPRLVHRALDKRNVHGAALSVLQLFSLIAQQTDAYPVATAMAKHNHATGAQLTLGITTDARYQDATLQAQLKMMFLHMQTVPDKISRLSKHILNNAASFGPTIPDQGLGAQWSAAALSALDLLDTEHSATDNAARRASRLVDLYYESKAELLQSQLAMLQIKKAAADEHHHHHSGSKNAAPDNAEEILSKIMLILQYDVILHPYQVFCLRNFPVSPGASTTSAAQIMTSLPNFDPQMVRAKCSHFLAAHLPLIRTKVKSILVSIAGTTASALGQMRQSLYDKTDGADCLALLNQHADICTWDQAVNQVVDIPTVAAGGGMTLTAPPSASTTTSLLKGSAAHAAEQPRFSLWSALFSNTFSSLVHSLLTTSFHSVHSKVVLTLRTSLACAPQLDAIRPHEAYRNTLKIATDLDQALWKVSEDAHELLVHAEERVESERRLRLSLYVQTCEIMGRLVCELRRMILSSSNQMYDGATDTTADAVKELIVGRLCYLLKFRLTSLSTLLDPKSSPAIIHNTPGSSSTSTSAGMITLMELQSAFELADDNEDGLITFEEAMEAVDSAFSGTQFHGAEMVRETLLLNSSSEATATTSTQDLAPCNSKDSMDSLNMGIATGGATPASVTPVNVTLNELALLTARGLRHETKGTKSALGTVQQALDDIVETCFQEWAKASLRKPVKGLSNRVTDFFHSAHKTTEEEWNRLHHPNTSTTPLVEKVTPHIVGYLLDVSSIMNRTVFPSDSLLPVPSLEYAACLGIVAAAEGGSPDNSQSGMIPTMKDTIRWSLVRQSLTLLTSTVQDVREKQQENNPAGSNPPISALLQLKTDLSFVQICFFERFRSGLASKFPPEGGETFLQCKAALTNLLDDTDTKLRRFPNSASVIRTIPEKHQQALNATDLFLSALFGGEEDTTSAAGAEMPAMSATGSSQTPLIENPLPSSRRFVLLPIQSDRGLTEAQLRKYGKHKEEENEGNSQDRLASGVGRNLQAGLGFLGNILRT